MFVNFLKFIWKNIGSLLLAFVLALVIWIFAAVSSDPNQELQYPNSISLNIIGKRDDLVLIGDIPKTVLTTLTAPISVWDKLLIDNQLISANIDLSELGVGSYQLPVNLTVGIEPVRIINISPLNIRFRLENLLEQEWTIYANVIGEPDLGYQLDDVKLSDENVKISGPESLISTIFEVFANINVSESRENSSKETDILVYDENGQRIFGLTLSPSKVIVEQIVTQTDGFKVVAVTAQTIGIVQSGYRVTSISYYPQTVLVSSSNPQLISNMPGYVKTQPLDITNANDDIEVNLVLELPDGVVLESEEQFILVQVGIAPIESSISLNISIDVINLDSGFEAILSPGEVEILLSGPVPILDELSIEDIVIVVDLLDLSIGTHLVSPTIVTFPDKILIESINPENIEVEIVETSSTDLEQTNPEITATPNP